MSQCQAVCVFASVIGCVKKVPLLRASVCVAGAGAKDKAESWPSSSVCTTRTLHTHTICYRESKLRCLVQSNTLHFNPFLSSAFGSEPSFVLPESEKNSRRSRRRRQLHRDPFGENEGAT